MRNFAKISPSIWRSQKFQSLGTDTAKLLYLYIHTCPHVTSLGCYVLPLGYIMTDLGWGEQKIREAMQALHQSGLIEWCEQEEVVSITRFLDFSPITNRKHAQGMLRLWASLPDCTLKNSVLSELEKSEWLDRPQVKAPAPAPATDDEVIPEDVWQAIDDYNALAARAELPVAKKRTQPRVRAVKARLKEEGGIDAWRTMLGKVERSDFLCGRGGDWKCNLDFISRKSAFMRIMEGNYENSRKESFAQRATRKCAEL